MPKPISPLFQELLLPRGVIKDQVYHALRHAILDGRLTAGSKIPSSRALAEMMAISRNSVISGFERLMDEGYLITRKGAGTFVCEHIPDNLISEYDSPAEPEAAIAGIGQLNPDVAALVPSWAGREDSGEMSQVFAVGIGCTDLFPHALWGRLLGRVWRQSRRELGSHATPYGYQPLRQAISHYIQATRGVNCHEDQVIIVNGIQQALTIAAQALLEKGDEVWLDDPGYNGARGAFAARGAVVRPVRVDGDGMDVEDGIRHYPGAKLVYTAPSHQFPLSGTLCLPRRLALLDWAEANRAWIFEDDYNSEFRYAARSLQALQGLDKYQRVIYSGTFSKMMYPEFRLGFLVVPAHLREQFAITKYYTDLCSGYLEQAVLARFISEGHYASHVRRIRKACFERKSALEAAIEDYFPGRMAVHPTDSGVHLVCWLLKGIKAKEVVEKARQIGLGVQTFERYCQRTMPGEGILLGFANHPPDVLVDGVRRLAAVL
ncbi:PLP-dependent aminotransferase family protein [Klebsiella spallanzanii]|uniref:HTH-type transcriptional regulatory protein GabR n=1 Tax=Klebsiella spallanzanii TaxID=2587528 RepID=A0A564I1J9_9ENTR|nr:PLP-dependent aminotransferase family protein [Klebsiella spallanzanii]VUS38177.1 HTH-type transcriptional regulatory protein GabR [Klebsiella spallanzanii]